MPSGLAQHAFGIGLMRERPVIESASIAMAEGQPVKTWTAYVTLWARIGFLNAREIEAIGKINIIAGIELFVRYRTDIDETMRVNWRSKVWNINGIQPDEFKQFMSISASREQ